LGLLLEIGQAKPKLAISFKQQRNTRTFSNEGIFQAPRAWLAAWQAALASADMRGLARSEP
jgi:hypothetical protein